MAENFVTDNKDGITHSGIVHKLLDKITTELAVKEFRGGYQKPVMMAGNPYMEYVPDSRAEYIQAISALTDILLPKFDEKMTEEYDEYIEAIEELDKEFKDKLEDMGDDSHKKYTREKVKLNRILFQRLNLLLDRTNYLKTAPREEGEDDEEMEDED